MSRYQFALARKGIGCLSIRCLLSLFPWLTDGFSGFIRFLIAFKLSMLSSSICTMMSYTSPSIYIYNESSGTTLLDPSDYSKALTWLL